MLKLTKNNILFNLLLGDLNTPSLFKIFKFIPNKFSFIPFFTTIGTKKITYLQMLNSTKQMYKILYIKLYKRFIHIHITDISGKTLLHLLPNTIYKFLNTPNYTIKQKHIFKKSKKDINLYIQMFRIIKSIIYLTPQNKIIIRQCGSHKFMRKLLTILIQKATPVTELDVPENEIDSQFSKNYLLQNISKYVFWGHKSYTTIKTKKQKSIKRKLYKRVYIKHYRFI